MKFTKKRIIIELFRIPMILLLASIIWLHIHAGDAAIAMMAFLALMITLLTALIYTSKAP